MSIIAKKQVLGYIAPGIDNQRNSEGDFIQITEKQVLFAYSRFKEKSFHDNAESDIAGIILNKDEDNLDLSCRILKKASDFGVDNLMSVSFLKMLNGDIGMFYIKKLHGVKSQIILSRSNDGCRTFYDDRICCPTVFDGYYVLNNNRVMRLSSNRIIIPLSYHMTSLKDGKEYFDQGGVVYFYYSDDDGLTWNRAKSMLCLPSQNTRTGLQEPGVIELPNGCLRAYFRTDQMVQYESFSYDYGLNWTVAQPSKFTSPDSPMKIAKNPYSGKYYAIWNPIPNYNGRVKERYAWGRTPLVIASSDNGIDFSEPEILEDDPKRGFCYPSVFFIDEKNMLLSYCSGGEEEKACLCRITITKLTVS
ncbi:MAG: hypothetical protein BWX97_02325 [Firmicutes bacterium ADurb.Bin146]|nr:MAG: hypothetical protein BWX97_02325 [Firmicutes bacterium ADurb.Bin146]